MLDNTKCPLSPVSIQIIFIHSNIQHGLLRRCLNRNKVHKINSNLGAQSAGSRVIVR